MKQKAKTGKQLKQEIELIESELASIAADLAELESAGATDDKSVNRHTKLSSKRTLLHAKLEATKALLPAIENQELRQKWERARESQTRHAEKSKRELEKVAADLAPYFDPVHLKIAPVGGAIVLSLPFQEGRRRGKELGEIVASTKAAFLEHSEKHNLPTK
jgi:hypothetical protein